MNTGTFMTPFMGILDRDNTPMDRLSPILPKFFVPRLTDKPQNPILDTVKESAVKESPSMRVHRELPRELTDIFATSDISSLPRRTSNLWLEAMARNFDIKVCSIFFLLLCLFNAMSRAKFFLGIDSVHLTQKSHLQLVFCPNKEVWYLRQLDISKLRRK
jgi:hypothetical protein